MSRLPLFLALAALPCLAPGQTLHFKDGRVATMPPAVLSGTSILVPLVLPGSGGGSAQLTLPISSLASVEWPPPAEVTRAEADLKAGRPADALRELSAVLNRQEAFMKIPGSWWTEGATIKAVALARLGRSDAATALLERLRSAKVDASEIARIETALVDHLISAGDLKAATSQLDAIQSGAADDASLAVVAVLRGRILEKSGEPEQALLSFLRVPVLYPAQDAQMPAALLGAAQAYRKLGDTARADQTLDTLATRFPSSPEALSIKH